MDTSKTFWLPEKASTFVDVVDPAFDLFLWISIFFFGLICILITVFTVKYLRRRPDQLATAQITHNLTLELSWTIIPLLIVMGLFFLGMKGFLHMRVAPGRLHAGQRQGPKVELELRISLGRRQRYPGRTGEHSRQAGHDVPRRAAQLFHSRLPHEGRRASQPLAFALVPGHPYGSLSGSLHPVLRHQPFLHAHGRQGSGAGSL